MFMCSYRYFFFTNRWKLLIFLLHLLLLGGVLLCRFSWRSYPRFIPEENRSAYPVIGHYLDTLLVVFVGEGGQICIRPITQTRRCLMKGLQKWADLYGHYWVSYGEKSYFDYNDMMDSVIYIQHHLWKANGYRDSSHYLDDCISLSSKGYSFLHSVVKYRIKWICF